MLCREMCSTADVINKLLKYMHSFTAFEGRRLSFSIKKQKHTLTSALIVDFPSIIYSKLSEKSNITL